MKSVVSLICSAIFIFSLSGDDWPHFLGPYGDTSMHEENIQISFPDSGFPLLWKRTIGGGYSGPAVVDGRVFIMDRLAEPYRPGKVEGNPNFIRAEIPGQERVSCVDSVSGALIWEYVYDCPYTTVFPYAIGPRCTPTVVGRYVYTLGAEGNLFCFNASDGRVIWSKDFKTDYALDIPEWGCAAHPLAYKDLLICIVGGDGSTVVAFDQRTGEERWRALSSSKPGYCPPTKAKIHGVEQLLVWHGDALVSLDPSTGTRHWDAGIKPLYGMSIGAPRVHGDLVHVMGYNNVSAAIRVGKDHRTAEVIWGPEPRKGVAGVLNTAHLDEDGYLYSAGGRRDFYCVDIRTGARVWESPLPLLNRHGKRSTSWPSAFTFHHTPSNKTFIYNDHGELISADLTPAGYRELSRTQLIEPTHRVGGRILVWSAPAFAEGRVYVRNDQEMRCYDLSGQHTDAKLGAGLLDLQSEFIEQKEVLSHTFRWVRDGDTVYEHAMDSGREGDHSIHEQTLFPIWSMTKPITSVAAMILYERELLKLDAPVSEVLPKLAEFRVQKSPDTDETEPLKRPITYRDLLLHTSGIYGYDGSFDEEGTWKQVMELKDLEGLIDLLAGIPLKHQPGERYTYGLSTAVLGAAIEKLSGQSLGLFLKESIFDPLGMKDTKFYLTPEDRLRFQHLHVKTEDGFRPGTTAEDELYYAPESQLFLGGEGLVSTMNDFGRFCQMLVDQGRAPDGREILSKETLDLMLSDQLGEVSGFGASDEGYVLGFGFQILKEKRGNEVASVGSFGWSGYHTTHFWIDPKEKQYGLFMTRLYPFNGDILTKIQKVIYTDP